MIGSSLNQIQKLGEQLLVSIHDLLGMLLQDRVLQGVGGISGLVHQKFGMAEGVIDIE